MNRFSALSLFCFWTAATAYAQSRTVPVTSENRMLPMRDGVRLATEMFLPAGPRPFPVILVRTPYDKSGLAAMGTNVAARGYAVVLQDTRGRFASEGENLPFYLDGPDGFDTVAWVRRQAWCNGKIGTFGGSALGITQFQMDASGVQDLACQHISVAGPNLYGDVVYTGGAFRKALVEDWLRLSHFSPRALELWTGHWAYDKFWLDRDASRHFANVNWPVVHIGGYFDLFAQGTIDAFLGIQKHGGPGARGHQKLLIGPWTHGVLNDRAGDLVFPNGKRPPNHVEDQMRFWDCYLKGVVNGFSELPAVTYYVMGDVSDPKAPGNCWRTSNQWPPVATRETRFYFQPDLQLSAERPRGNDVIGYQDDPANPVPTIGGYELTIPAGPKDQRPIETRPDMIVFSSQPLANPLEVTGQVRVKLYVSTDVADTDFLARLCDVYPDGRSFNICEGVLRARFRHSFIEEEPLKPGHLYAIELNLWPTSIVFNKGHRLRIDVTSSSSPAYDPNPNTGEPLRWSSRTAVAHTTLYVSSRYPSSVDFPIASGSGPQ